MTQKSLARKERDALTKAKSELQQKFDENEDLKDNNQWDDLNSVFRANCKLIATTAVTGEILNKKELIECVEDKRALTEQIKILTRDLTQLNNELLTIQSKHKDKSGHADIDDVFITLQLFELYELWTSQYYALVEPTMAQIIEMTHRAEVVMAERAAATAVAETTEASLANSTDEVAPVETVGEEVQTETTETGAAND